MTIFVETFQFNQMISYTPYADTQREKRKVKYNLLDSIKESIGDKWERLKEGTRQTFDLVCFFGSELGFFYASDEYLAKRHGVSDRTVRNRLKELEELGQVVKVHRRAKKCNGRGKPVYLFVNHPYFIYWKELLNITDFHAGFQTENAETPSGSKDEGNKKVSTYLLPKKQERDIIYNYVFNRVNDSFKKGNIIKYMSSYVHKVVTSLERQSLYAENNRQIAIKKKQQEELSRKFRENLGITKKVPFYNWLEE